MLVSLGNALFVLDDESDNKLLLVLVGETTDVLLVLVDEAVPILVSVDSADVLFVLADKVDALPVFVDEAEVLLVLVAIGTVKVRVKTRWLCVNVMTTVDAVLASFEKSDIVEVALTGIVSVNVPVKTFFECVNVTTRAVTVEDVEPDDVELLDAFDESSEVVLLVDVAESLELVGMMDSLWLVDVPLVIESEVVAVVVESETTDVVVESEATDVVVEPEAVDVVIEPEVVDIVELEVVDIVVELEVVDVDANVVVPLVNNAVAVEKCPMIRLNMFGNPEIVAVLVTTTCVKLSTAVVVKVCFAVWIQVTDSSTHDSTNFTIRCLRPHDFGSHGESSMMTASSCLCRRCVGLSFKYTL